MKNYKDQLIAFGIAILLFIIISIIYLSPALQGKQISQHDITQHIGMSKELVDFRNETGEEGLWTNSIFCGMPAYLISTNYKANVLRHFHYIFLLNNWRPVGFIFLYMLGFFITMLAFGINRWLSIVGALAYAFSSYFLVIIAAGHNSKVFALGYMPAIIAGVYLAFNNRYLIGAALIGLFLSLQIYINHLQISYYTFLIILIFGIFQLVQTIKEKNYKPFITATLVIIIAVILAIGSNFSKLWNTYEYGKYSIRGKSELTLNQDNQTSGLDKDYATQWSYGIDETLTLLIPNFKGGSSAGAIPENSETFKYLNKIQGAKQARKTIARMPTYWGKQPITSGPVYVGAVIVFLFILSLFIVKGKIRNWLVTVTIISIVLSWGHNIPNITNFFLDHFPGYNKFRTVTMILIMAEFAIPLLAMIALNDIIKGKIPKEKLKSYILKSLYITAGTCLFFIITASAFFNFEAASDQNYIQQGADLFVNALQADRAMLLRRDAFRSIVFIGIAVGILLFYTNGKIKQNQVILALGFLILVDLWTVDKRYLNNDNFIPKKKYENPITKTRADKFILDQTQEGEYFRVFNISVSTFNDATTSYYHKSLGGYHGAKMRKYQELIEYQIQPEVRRLVNSMQRSGTIVAADTILSGSPALRMLNARYLIYSADHQPVLNRWALGNVWFVNNIEFVPNADAEILALKNINPATTAIVQTKYQELIPDLQIKEDSLASIELISYAPNKLVYQSNTSSEQLAVFSEIYYPKGWEVTIDGTPVEYLSANYVLRALKIPAGKHEIVFSFIPKSYYVGNKISLASSVILMLLLLSIVALEIKKIVNDK